MTRNLVRLTTGAHKIEADYPVLPLQRAAWIKKNLCANLREHAIRRKGMTLTREEVLCAWLLISSLTTPEDGGKVR